MIFLQIKRNAVKIDFRKIGLVLQLALVGMIIYKLKTNPGYFDYFLVVALFWYGYGVIFRREEILNFTARDCKIFAFFALLLLFNILFLQDFLEKYFYVWPY